MREPGDQRIPGTEVQPARVPAGKTVGRPARRSPLVAFAGACSVALLAATSWAILRGIFELGPGSLVVALAGGWGIGVMLRQANGAPLLAGVIGLGAWLLGLILTWLLAMAILPGSTRSFLERVEGTPFLDWLSPQFGLLEVAGLVLWVGAAAYAARTRLRPRQREPD